MLTCSLRLSSSFLSRDLLSRKVIREDFTIEAYDILELHCELVAERMRLVASHKEVPPDMEQAVCTIIWAADRAEVRATDRMISYRTVVLGRYSRGEDTYGTRNGMPR